MVKLAGAAIGALATLVAALLMLPKIMAQARNLNAEASRTEWQTLRDEIDRLNKTVTAQDKRIAEIEAGSQQRADRATELETENRKLKNEIAKLKTRVSGLEEVFKIGPVTPEMQAALDKLGKFP